MVRSGQCLRSSRRRYVVLLSPSLGALVYQQKTSERVSWQTALGDSAALLRTLRTPTPKPMFPLSAGRRAPPHDLMGAEEWELGS